MALQGAALRQYGTSSALGQDAWPVFGNVFKSSNIQHQERFQLVYRGFTARKWELWVMFSLTWRILISSGHQHWVPYFESRGPYNITRMRSRYPNVTLKTWLTTRDWKKGTWLLHIDHPMDYCTVCLFVWLVGWLVVWLVGWLFVCAISLNLITVQTEKEGGEGKAEEGEEEQHMPATRRSATKKNKKNHNPHQKTKKQTTKERNPQRKPIASRKTSSANRWGGSWKILFTTPAFLLTRLQVAGHFEKPTLNLGF